MPKYIYECLDCEKLAKENHKDRLIAVGEEFELEFGLYEELVLFETAHSMEPSEEELREATQCPRCKGHNCHKSFNNLNISGYVRGYGWMDKAGAQRDMNLYKLEKDDPYKQHRVAGEADDIATKLRKAGKHNPKSKYVDIKPVAENTVKKAIDKG